MEQQEQIKLLKVNERALKETISVLEKEQVEINHRIHSKTSIAEDLHEELANLRLKHEQLRQSIKSKEFEDKERDEKYLHQEHLIKELSKKLKELERRNDSSAEAVQKFESLSGKMKSLESVYKLIKTQIQCPYGHELLNPVTIIPCGHNYCLGCKRGYKKECVECDGKLKIEAVYRNELMDDIIGMVRSMQHILEIMK